MLLTPHEQVSGSLALCEKSDEGQPCSSPLDEGWLSLLSPLTPGWRSQALGTSHVSSLPGSPGPPCIQCPSSPRRRPSPHLDTRSPPSPRPTAQACRRCRLSPSSLSAVRSGDQQHRLDPLPSPLPALALGRDARSLRRPSRAASGPTMAEGAGAARTDDGGTPTGATGSTRSRGSISFTDSSVRPPSLSVVCPRRAITDRLETSTQRSTSASTSPGRTATHSRSAFATRRGSVSSSATSPCPGRTSRRVESGPS